MAARTRWWQEQTANCEDAIARALTARKGLEESILWVRGVIRRASGDTENFETLLAVLLYLQKQNNEHLALLRTERKELNHVPTADCAH